MWTGLLESRRSVSISDPSILITISGVPALYCHLRGFKKNLDAQTTPQTNDI